MTAPGPPGPPGPVWPTAGLESAAPSDLVVEEHDAVEEFEDEPLDGLAMPGGSRHHLAELARLELAELLRGTQVRYLLARDADRRPVGLLPCYRTSEPLPAAIAPEPVGGAAAEQAHLLGSPGAVANYLAVAPGLDPAGRRAPGRLLVEHALRAARTEPAAVTLMPYLTDAQRELVPAELRRGALLRQEPVARLDIDWPDFDAYVSSLAGSRRAGVRKERRRFLASGIAVSEEAVLDVCEEIAPLVHQVEQRYGRSTTADQIEFYLTGLGLAMADSGFALVARRGAELLGVCVIWEREGDWVIRCWGCDYALTDRESLYYNLVFYEPIARAIERGIPRIQLGPHSIVTKRTRGCAVEELHTLLLAPSGPTAPNSQALPTF
ncbi:peptidogalycan biosysnthesis protein [Kitasatospora sp. NPDC008050]|uniref:peptidogalycan biosysnthesis protein n=1 Tax=Kitasatospora sp. NPDC008050 TaxID=3364021 RepID=UPI0036EF8C5A